MSGAADKKKFVFTGRWIPEKSDAGQVYFSGKYWATDDLGLGLDYRPLVDSVSFTATPPSLLRRRNHQHSFQESLRASIRRDLLKSIDTSL